MSTVEALRIALDAIVSGDLVTINIVGDGYNHTITYNEGEVKEVLLAFLQNILWVSHLYYSQRTLVINN